MELVSFVDPDDLSPAMRTLWEQSPRPGLKKFAQVMAHAERFHLMFAELNAAIRFENHLGNKLTELVRLTIANTTRCPVCMAGRLPQAVAEGMTEEMVQALDHVDDVDPGTFTDAERAAVRFAEKFGTDHLSVDEADAAALRAHFSDEQIVELAILCALCLGYGRFSAILGLDDAAPAPVGTGMSVK